MPYKKGGVHAGFKPGNDKWAICIDGVTCSFRDLTWFQRWVCRRGFSPDFWIARLYDRAEECLKGWWDEHEKRVALEKQLAEVKAQLLELERCNGILAAQKDACEARLAAVEWAMDGRRPSLPWPPKTPQRVYVEEPVTEQVTFQGTN